MKSVLITGCTNGGIGSAMALAFAQHGLLVFAAARKVSKMTNLDNLPNVKLLELDVTDTAQIRSATELVRKETGGTLDYLINNAGRDSPSHNIHTRHILTLCTKFRPEPVYAIA
jgi:NADP-dependent 3-hydroxy acid dehydrogenase YdfG